MSIRIKITLLFATIVLIILALVCGSVYYFSYTSRLNNIRTRLTNWAITTGRLLSQSAVFDQGMVMRIDASTTLAMKHKTVQAYDYMDIRRYIYSDDASDTASFDSALLERAGGGRDVYFVSGDREGIAHRFAEKGLGMVMVAAAYDEEGIRKLQQLKFILLLSFAGGILTALAAGYFFSKQLLIPLRKIADEVNKISVQNLEERIRTRNGNDEWDYLTSTLNRLLNRLQESFDVHRRFISNASHELLTPLTSISSQLEITLNRERGPEEYKTIMASVYQDVLRLGKLTQTLLEFARASGDPGGLEIDLVRVDEILFALPREITKLNGAYIVELAFGELPEEDEKLLVFGNGALLFTAIKNIVINACKYSSDHRAEVKLSCRHNVITISIWDGGGGIPMSERENIFQPFYRAGDENMDQGFGLGLSLAQQIIKLHKGQISLRSIIGEGTVFDIMLPSAGTLLRDGQTPGIIGLP